MNSSTLKYILLIFMTFSTASILAQTKVAFEVSFTEPQAHYVDVQMEITGNKKDKLDLKMPVWTPGSYLIREFAKNLEGFKAIDAKGKLLTSDKIDKNTWRIQNAATEKIKITYRIYAFEVSVRTSFVDASHAFISPSGIFLYPDDQIKSSSTVTINLPKGWFKISTGLDAIKGKENTFFASDFDILYDSPFEIGNQDTFEFTAAGVLHQVAMFGGGNYNKERLKKDMAKIVEEETSIFGENPNDRYVFIIHNFNAGGGGLEHLNSAVLGASRNNYNSEPGYSNFLGLVSHEYFHLWNVKRLRPIALGPFNYDKENYTTNLWIAEGFTAYYDNLILRRAGFYSLDRYLEVISQDLNTIENQPGNQVQSASESSFDAWIKFYRPNENSKNSTISYYGKGSLIAMIMDLEVLNATKGQKKLDDVMKAMYDEYYIKLGRGYTDAEFKAMLEKVSGVSFTYIYDNYVNGSKPIEYAKYFGYAGLGVNDDMYGRNLPYLGVSSSLKEGKLIVTEVARNSAAWNDGISVNDEIIAIDNARVSELEKIIASKKVGDKVDVIINRDGIIKVLRVTLGKNPLGRLKIINLDDATADEISIRNKWLNL
ncbi:MAG: peptidase [Sphingobacteriales bacterium]|nr:peptidase [Sphingobacteriales bacterium]